jgi:high-affinity nickel permease
VGAGLHIGLVATALGFGFRHGIDWDHIAALTDLTGAQDRPRRSMLLATLYATGHATVVFLLGLAAIVLAARLPPGIDGVMERIVGATLLMLGVYVVCALVRRGREFRMRSRWMLLATSIRSGAARLRGPRPVVVIEHEHAVDAIHAPDRASVGAHMHSLPHDEATHVHHDWRLATMPADPFPTVGWSTALLIGMLHGIGAETPTQVLIFVTAAGVAGKGGGVVLLVCFLVGLFAANTAVGLVGTFGMLRATRNFYAYAAVSLVTAAFSVVTGSIFMLGHAGSVPSLLGG